MTPIWIYWDQGWDNAPAFVQECVASWESKNPDYEVRRLSSENIEGFLDLTDETRAMLAGLRIQTRTDVYRLMLLKAHGGLWVDATLYCNKPLTDWLDLSPEHPVALFENPGPDRFVSSWFLAALPDSPLINMWLNEFMDYLTSLRDPATPKGLRKIIQKIFQWVFGRSVKASLLWWHSIPNRVLSIAPYYSMHYCYNRLALQNPTFAKLAGRKIGIPADPAHAAQFLLAGKPDGHDVNDITNAYVHKLNWRKLRENETIADALIRLTKDHQT